MIYYYLYFIRFRNLPENRKCNVIKQRVLETLHLAFWHCLIHFWECTMSPLYAILNEQNSGSSPENVSTLPEFTT